MYAKREALGQHLASVYAGLGDNDQAFAWLKKIFSSVVVICLPLHGGTRLKTFAETHATPTSCAAWGSRHNLFSLIRG